MRQKLAGERETEKAFRHFSTGASAFGNRIGFRFVDGRMKSLPYTHLVETEYNPDIGIILEFVGNRVTLTGRNLHRLYEHLEDELIGEVVEQHANEMTLEPDEAFVSRVRWEKI